MSGNPGYNSWHDVYNNGRTGYALKINSGMTEKALFDVCADMLEELKDPHVGLYAPGIGYRSYNFGSNEYFNIIKARSYLNGYGDAGYKNFVFGVFSSDPGIGYVYINEFINEDHQNKDREWGKAIDHIIDSLENTRALVLDVRNNRGGDVNVMEYIAARFAAESKDYCKVINKNGPGPDDFSAPVIYTVKSVNKTSGGKRGYVKPVVLITNGNTISVAEWFTLALKTQGHVIHAGTTTCGAFSPRKDRFMINGWVYSISPGRVTDMDGKNYEGAGISPDKEEHVIANTTNQKDKQLEEAFKIAAGAEEEG